MSRRCATYGSCVLPPTLIELQSHGMCALESCRGLRGLATSYTARSLLTVATRYSLSPGIDWKYSRFAALNSYCVAVTWLPHMSLLGRYGERW